MPKDERTRLTMLFMTSGSANANVPTMGTKERVMACVVTTYGISKARTETPA